jgi:hypothetical protein
MYSCEGASIHDDNDNDNDNAVCGPADAEGLEKSYDSESRQGNERKQNRMAMASKCI